MLAGCTHAAVVELSEKLAALTGLGHASYGSRWRVGHRNGAKDEHPLLAQHRSARKERLCRSGRGLPRRDRGGAVRHRRAHLPRSAYAPLVRLSATVPSPDARAAQPGETAADVARRAAAALEAWLQQHHARPPR